MGGVLYGASPSLERSLGSQIEMPFPERDGHFCMARQTFSGPAKSDLHGLFTILRRGGGERMREASEVSKIFGCL